MTPQTLEAPRTRPVQGPGSAEPFDWPAPATGGREGRGLSVGVLALLWALAAGLLGSWGILAAWHAADRFEISHVSGAWMALAMHAADGTLYPPLFDGASYGGTRFMPVPILLHAGIAQATGEFLLSGKLLGYASFAMMLGAAFAALRMRRAPMGLAAALTACIIPTNAAILIGLSIRNDALPVALSLFALMLIDRREGRAATLAAAGLCALAFLSKFSALWAPAAIGVWLLVCDRRRLILFCVSCALFTAGGLAAFHFASGGRMFQNLFGLSTSGMTGAEALIISPVRILWHLFEKAPLAWALLLPAGIGALVAARQRSVSIYHVAMVFAAGLLVVIYADRGANDNHLIDVIALTMILAGDLWARVEEPRRAMAPLQVALAGLVLWAAPFAFGRSLGDRTMGAARDMMRGDRSTWRNPRPMEGALPADAHILSEDPFIPVSMGAKPVVLDPFMLLRTGKDHPEWIASLVERLDEKEFDAVVLVRRIDDEAERDWYDTMHFGPEVSEAIRRNYQFSARVDAWLVYEPRPREGGELHFE